MRENIGLFRGLDRTSEKLKWVYGGLVIMCDPHSGANDIYEIVDENGRFTQVIPSSVGECTGIMDSNGRLIFENDTVTINGLDGDQLMHVTFEEGEFVLRCKELRSFRAPLLIVNLEHITSKVVGFIYDGTELYEA